MKAKKFLAMLLAAMMTFSLVACGGTTADQGTSGNEAETQENAEADAAPAADVTIENPSIDFSDGQIGFLGNDKVINPSGDDSVIQAGEFNGVAAAQITPQGKNPFIAIQMDALVGDAIGDVASVAVTVGIDSGDGNFYAASGSLYEVIGGAKSGGTTWSIYKEDLNPRTIVHELSGAAAEGDYMVLSMESDVARDNGLEPAGLYILDITFLDADGNTIEADSSAEYADASAGADRSNLFGITSASVVEGLSGKSDGWNQISYDISLSDEQFELLKTPGSVVEVSYTADTGNMWIVMVGGTSTKGIYENPAWVRIGVGDADGSGQGYAYTNNSKTTVQITHEMIAEVYDEDVDTWGNQIVCESDGPYEVFSVKIGQQAPSYVAKNVIDLGVSGSEVEWKQIGYQALTEEQLELLKTPGSIIEIEYTSESGNIWAGFNTPTWFRVAQDTAICDGNTCYITYDMIVDSINANEDVNSIDDIDTIFIESDTPYEVYSVKIGMAAEIVPNKNQIDLGVSGSEVEWQQIGYQALTEEQLEALKTEGSVIVITYTSESGNIWAGFNTPTWFRVAQDSAICDGNTCYITYDMIVDSIDANEDVNSIDDIDTIFIESDTPYEVYSVTIGQTE